MGLFHIIEDAQCILRSKGVYRQAKVYERNDKRYAAYGAGYIELRKKGYTSHPDVGWLEIEGCDV